MGRATRWLRSLFGGKKDSKENQSRMVNGITDNHMEKKRWSFKSARDFGEPAAPGGRAAWLRLFYAETEKEQNKHAIAVAAATAAAADAAVAAAQAAIAVVKLTSHCRGSKPVDFREWLASVKIQRVFRGFLAKKALRALKALVKLQALVRGYLVRKQAAAAFHSMQALIKAQATIRAQKSRTLLPSEKITPLEACSFQLRGFSPSLDNQDSPKIVQVDSCLPKSKPSRRSTYSIIGPCHEISPNSISSPLPNLRRIFVPDCRFSLDKCQHSSTVHSTPRSFTPNTPAKSVCGTRGDIRTQLHSFNDCPNYMASTQSFDAKLRSQSAPKQRPETPGSSKRLPLSELAIEQSRSSLSGMQRMEEEFSFKKAVMGRLDRSLELNREADRKFQLQKKW